MEAHARHQIHARVKVDGWEVYAHKVCSIKLKIMLNFVFNLCGLAESPLFTELSEWWNLHSTKFMYLP